jgi:uridine kinase
MNILEAYIKKYKQFIILILGLPCSNKSEIAKELVEDLHLPIININDYLKENAFVEKIVSDVKFKLYEHPDNYDWIALNKDVNEKKSQGVIIYGNYFDGSKIDFEFDFCYFFSMNTNLCKNILIEKKMLPYKEDDQKVKIYFNDIFNPIYEELKKDIKINKFFNIKENTTFDEVYDEVFNNLMKLIKDKI